MPEPSRLRAWLRLASRPSIIRRGLAYAVIVGAALIAINHGDAILRGDVSTGRLLQMALTTLVPYVVSTLSSVGALRAQAVAQAGDGNASNGS